MTSPRFSVVIATYARNEQLGECLAMLARLEPPVGGFEVVVVDDGSPTPVADVVERARAIPGATWSGVTLVRRANGGPGAARNDGVAAARGAYVVFTDDDCRPVPGWLRAYEALLADHPARPLGGPVRNGLRENAFAEASQLLVTYLYRYHNVPRTDARFFTTSNFLVPRPAFEGVGGFDTRVIRGTAEDRDLVARLRRAGHVPVFAEGPVVYHYHHMGPRRFWRQQFAYGRGAVHYHRARVASGEPDVPPPGFFLGLLAFPFTTGSPPVRRSLPMAALLALSQAAYAAGFAAELLAHGVRRGRREVGGVR